MFMSLVPVAGPLLALLSAYKLLRGRLGAATITTTSGGVRSVRSYAAKNLGRAGVPAGLLLVMLACAQPLLGLYLLRAEPGPEAPEGPRPEVAPRAVEPAVAVDDPERFGKYACEGVLACYPSDFVGQVAGRLVMEVDAAGRVTGADVRVPDAAPPILGCIRRVCDAKRIPDFTGPGGRLVCEYAGSIAGKTRSMNISAQFIPLAERP
jgi:hypothetical protein